MRLLALAATAAAHSNLIYPKPRNAIDSSLPEWANGSAPYVWAPSGSGSNPPGEPGDPPCACRNGTDACDAAQTCLWMSVGCSIGCDTCDGGSVGGTNPNSIDRCPGVNPDKKVATINDPKHRTFNRGAAAGSDDDWTRFNPWRAPGLAPVYDACGRAGGGPTPTAGHGEFTNTTFARFGDLGSRVLPYYATGAVWEAGATVETTMSVRANHGGGWQYRLCPRASELTEACFQQTPMDFARDSRMTLKNGTTLDLTSTFVTDGTLPMGGTWVMNPIPCSSDMQGGLAYQFEPPCDETTPPGHLTEGVCSGEWITNITVHDYLRVPEHLEAGDYVLGFRWDCESSAQVWQACADVTITKS